MMTPNGSDANGEPSTDSKERQPGKSKTIILGLVVVVVVVIAIVLAVVLTRDDSSPSVSSILRASNGAANDEFGWAVDISGNTAVVGSYGDDEGGSNTDSGSAYVFYKSSRGWLEEPTQRLVANDASPGDHFGRSVAIDGNTIVIGAPSDDRNKGSAYVFSRDSDDETAQWRFEAKLTADDGKAGDSFGEAVAISGDRIVVGAYRANGGVDGSLFDSGSAYIYTRTTPAGAVVWGQEAKLVAEDGAADDQFGISVSIGGDRLVVGAWGSDSNNLTDSGSAYVFAHVNSTMWTQEGKLTASTAGIQDRFGYSVAIDENTVISGAWGKSTFGTRDGTAYVYERGDSSGTWVERAQLLASDGSAFDTFGISVAISGDIIIVGAPGNVAAGSSDGRAYVFVRDASTAAGWVEHSKLVPSDLGVVDKADSEFGQSVSVDGSNVVVGAHHDHGTGGSFSGSVYTFESVV